MSRKLVIKFYVAGTKMMVLKREHKKKHTQKKDYENIKVAGTVKIIQDWADCIVSEPWLLRDNRNHNIKLYKICDVFV